MTIELPAARSVVINPSQEQMRAWVAEMPNAQLTEFGNWNVKARVTARSGGSTFVVTEEPQRTSKQVMDRQTYAREAARQDAHIAACDMICLEGYIGPETSPMRVPARVYIERDYANIPAMQDNLYFPKDAHWREADAFTVIYTPSLAAPGYPEDRLICIDVDNWVTRVFNADYFGESKMGGLRMWNEWVHQRGGLAMHAGAKVVPVGDRARVFLIVGLSGTGKTTTTFRQQNASLPVQDDFVALTAAGEVFSTEDGCFAKTHGLDPDDEPTIYKALTQPSAWLENVAVDGHGRVDFLDDSYTANGRGTFPLSEIPHHDPRELGRAEVLLILNRNETIVPAVAKMASKEQAVAYFMLGETKGTSAGGAAEAGKNLRVPGTNPFFLRHDHLQGERLAELIDTMTHDFEVFVLNTGRVGGSEGVEGSKNVTIPDSSAIVKAIAEGTISWTTDPDFGYWVAEDVPGVTDPELLQPRRLYQRLGRTDDYEESVSGLKKARVDYLEGHGLAPEFVDAVR